MEIELPEGARLLTVWVEGAPVKPVRWPTAGDDRRLRIPLVKTPPGDLDYPVQLKFAGRLGSLAMLNQIEFPVVQTLNINVQLSQLQLRLPESYQWLYFDGTMTRVNSQGDLEQGYLSYKRQQIQRLAEQVKGEAAQFGSFAKSRALENLGRLSKEMSDYQQIQTRGGVDVAGKDLMELESQLFGNQEAIRAAQQSADGREESGLTLQSDNRDNFNGLLVQQKSKLARNAVIRQGKNWKEKSGYRAAPAESQSQTEGKFDQEWFARNKLESGRPEDGQKLHYEPPSSDLPVQGELQGQQLQSAAGQAGADVLLLDESISYANPVDQTIQLGDAYKLPPPMDPMAAARDEGRRQNQDFDLASVADGTRPRVSGLASLSIELPERGVDFYFKSPRGNAMVTARPIPQRSITHWLTALAALGLSAILWIGWFIGRRLGQSVIWRIIGFALLVLFGLYSIGMGVLPVFGLIALIAAAAMVVEYTIRLIDSLKPTTNVPQT